MSALCRAGRHERGSVVGTRDRGVLCCVCGYELYVSIFFFFNFPIFLFENISLLHTLQPLFPPPFLNISISPHLTSDPPTHTVWESCSPAVEIAQGRAIASAALAANVSLLIWSSLPNVIEMTGGKLRNVYHFDSKAMVETYIRGLSIRSVFFWDGWYM